MLSSTPQPTIPPLVHGPLIGSCTINLPSLRWLTKPITNQPPQKAYITLSWWGSSDSTDCTTLKPTIHSLGKSVHPSPPSLSISTFPIVGGLEGLTRYLRDMSSLTLIVYSVDPVTSTSTPAGRCNIPITTRGVKGVHPCVDDQGVVVAEVKGEIMFELGRYGDNEECRKPSRLINDMPKTVSDDIDREGSNAVAEGVTGRGGSVVTSFQMNEAVAMADEGKEDMKVWPERDFKPSYVPPEKEGNKVESGTVGMEVGGKKIEVKGKGMGLLKHGPKEYVSHRYLLITPRLLSPFPTRRFLSLARIAPSLQGSRWFGGGRRRQEGFEEGARESKGGSS